MVVVDFMSAFMIQNRKLKLATTFIHSIFQMSLILNSLISLNGMYK